MMVGFLASLFVASTLAAAVASPAGSRANNLLVTSAFCRMENLNSNDVLPQIESAISERLHKGLSGFNITTLAYSSVSNKLTTYIIARHCHEQIH